MARRITSLLLFLALVSSRAVLAAGLDDQSKADAKQATHLFNLGKYEEALPIYAKLAFDHPDMVVFLRNLGACNYYLRRPEPAISNLRRYLKLRSDIKPQDRSTVERWIDEMEKLRATQLASQAPRGHETGPGANAPAAAAISTAAPPPAEPVRPVGLRTDVRPSPPVIVSRPFYKTWWFWAGAAVAAAAVTTAIILSRDSAGPCDGRGTACLVTE